LDFDSRFFGWFAAGLDSKSFNVEQGFRFWPSSARLSYSDGNEPLLLDAEKGNYKMENSNQILEQDSRKNAGTGCDIYGSDRLHVALVVREILNELELEWFIEFGTLLGAFRNHKFIDHDDDFDIAFLMYTKNFLEDLNELYHKIKERLPTPLDCRITNSYTDKIEISDPTWGKFILLNHVYKGADFHYVTVDIQPFIVNEETSTAHSPYRAKPFKSVWDIDLILPLKNILLEGEEFLCPNDPKKILEEEYGSIEPGAIYDEKTGNTQINKRKKREKC
jgi:hypothetical protein